jgi:probable rRNA maturation factor
MIIAIDNRTQQSLPTDDYVALAEFVLQAEQAASNVELSLSLVEPDEIQALNRQYRGVDAATDVLSFECDQQVLGDVIICPEIARRHALDFDSTFEAEMQLMLTHGVLHLLGYDHIDDDQAELMEARENELLRQWNER